MKKVIGIGGIFFKSKDPEAMRQWYATHLGFQTSSYGATFDWRDESAPEKTGSTTWSPFPENTDHFKPSEKDFMLNLIVDDIVALVAELKNSGITVVGEIQDYPPYGKFAHIMDLEGNKVELWQASEEA